MANERNYFITIHHQAGVYFENFTEVKFRDILLTGTVPAKPGCMVGLIFTILSDLLVYGSRRPCFWLWLLFRGDATFYVALIDHCVLGPISCDCGISWSSA